MWFIEQDIALRLRSHLLLALPLAGATHPLLHQRYLDGARATRHPAKVIPPLGGA